MVSPGQKLVLAEPVRNERYSNSTRTICISLQSTKLPVKQSRPQQAGKMMLFHGWSKPAVRLQRRVQPKFIDCFFLLAFIIILAFGVLLCTFPVVINLAVSSSGSSKSVSLGILVISLLIAVH